VKINITSPAKEKLEKAFQESKLTIPALRVTFAGFGWGGPRLGLALDELENNSDTIIETGGIKVLLDERVKHYLESIPPTTVDYFESRHGGGFVIQGLPSC